MIKILVWITLLIQCIMSDTQYKPKVVNNHQDSNLSLNKANINTVYSYTGKNSYTFTYLDSNFKNEKSSEVDFFVVNFHQFIEPIVNPEAASLVIYSLDKEGSKTLYFDSKELIQVRGGSRKFTEKWLNFNENFFCIPLKGFEKYEIQLTVEPLKFKSLNFNRLEDQIDKKQDKNDKKLPLNLVKFVAQVYSNENIALSKNVFYPMFLAAGKAGFMMVIKETQIAKDHKLYLEIVSCHKVNLIGSIDVEYLDSAGNSDKSDMVKPNLSLIELSPGSDTKMIKIKITKDFSDENLFLKVKLRSVPIKSVNLFASENSIGSLSTVLDDLSQVINGTMLLSEDIDMPITDLEIGQAYRASKIDSEINFVTENFEKSISGIYASKSLDSPSMRCGYNPEILEYYTTALDRKYPLTMDALTDTFVELRPYQTIDPEQIDYLDLRATINQKLKTLYVKKFNAYNSKNSDMSEYIATSELFGICSNSPIKSLFQKMLYYIALGSFVILMVYGVYFLGKKKLGALGEQEFERQQQNQAKGFEMIQSGPTDLSVVHEQSGEEGSGFEDDDLDFEDEDFEIDVDVDQEL